MVSYFHLAFYGEDSSFCLMEFDALFVDVHGLLLV